MLVHVAMQRHSRISVPLKAFQQGADIALTIAEDNAIGHFFAVKKGPQRRALAHRGNLNKRLRHIFIGRRGRRDLNVLRCLQELFRQAGNFRRHGGREKQRLACEGQKFHNAFNVRNKAHIQHPVSFVNHQNFDAAQHHLAALNMVEQATRCGNQHIGTALNGPLLITK